MYILFNRGGNYMIEGKQINLDTLPSRGVTYPEDIEIYVKPMTLKEEISSSAERFGVSKAGYYDSLLNSIVIKGNFNKRHLLLGDVQMLDLIRRLYTFELEEPIYAKGYVCPHCGEVSDIKFNLHELNFTDFGKEIFGKEFIFSDGMTVSVSPITIDKFIKICKKFLSNTKVINGIPDVSSFVPAFYAASVVEVKGRTFSNEDTMFNYMYEYFSNVSKYKDRKIITAMDLELSSTIVPLEILCKQCSKTMEVYVESSMEFFQ